MLRGVVGFGIDGNVRRASILELSGNLPLAIELVDDEEKLRVVRPTGIEAVTRK